MDDKIKDLFRDLERYIEEYWIAPDEDLSAEREAECLEEEDFGGITFEEVFRKEKYSKEKPAFLLEAASVSLDDLFDELGKPFHEVLFEKIAESGMTDVEVYKRANMDRKLFSKIRSNPAYHPGKDTVLALAIALKLDIDQTQDLLSRAEYAFSPSSKSDVIIRYFIEREVFDIDLINIALYDHGLAILE